MTTPAQGGDGGPGPTPLRFVGLGFELVVPLLAGVLLGHWLDGRFGTRPWMLLAGTVLGMAAGFVNFLRSVLPGSQARGKDGR